MSTELNESHIGKMINVWGNRNCIVHEREFLGIYQDGRVCCRNVPHGEKVTMWRHGRPIQTEAEKFLERWKGKKITHPSFDCKWLMPTIVAGEYVTCMDDIGDGRYIGDFTREYTLWEEPEHIPPEPETRLMTAVELTGKWIRTNNSGWHLVTTINIDGKRIGADRTARSWYTPQECHDSGGKWADHPSHEPKSLMVEVK